MEWTISILITLSGLMRALLICWGRIQDYAMELPFTDVDYKVFTDAARHLSEGRSPYLTPTYRYTPALAYLLIPNLDFADFGKILFNIADLVAAWLIYHIVLTNTPGPKAEAKARWAAGLWLFNPITSIVSSRGNAEGLVSLFVLGALQLLLGGHWAAAAVLHGFGAISLKIYPVIYLPPVFIFLLRPEERGLSVSAPWSYFKALLCNWQGYAYVILCLGSFALPTALSYLRFGDPFLNQALLYHVSRVDIRHNFSPYFYVMYLGEGKPWAGYLGLAAFVPQALLVLAFAFRFAPRDLPFTLFLSTFAFVTFNKVVTSQYFVWYLSLVPLVSAEVSEWMSTRHIGGLVGAWVGAQGLWLLAAWLFEFRGLDTFLAIWLSSLLFFAVNAWILGALTTLKLQQTHHRDKTKGKRLAAKKNK